MLSCPTVQCNHKPTYLVMSCVAITAIGKASSSLLVEGSRATLIYCRWRRLRTAFALLMTMSAAISLLIVARLHCHSQWTVRGRPQSRMSGRSSTESGYDESRSADDDATKQPLLCLFTTFKPASFKKQVLLFIPL
jgi:hypothetical protein